MSTADAKRPLAAAVDDAEAFRALFPPTAYARWVIAGSIRRNKPHVGDVEHVVMPRMGDVAGDGLFGEPLAVNLLLHRLDELLAAGTITKHIYPDDKPRWGPVYRGCEFRGFTHEVFCAFPDNWGAILMIRTGPADFSQRMVDRLLRGGLYRQRDGYLVHVQSNQVAPVPDEETYFRMAGMDYMEPDRRGC